MRLRGPDRLGQPGQPEPRRDLRARQRRRMHHRRARPVLASARGRRLNRVRDLRLVHVHERSGAAQRNRHPHGDRSPWRPDPPGSPVNVAVPFPPSVTTDAPADVTQTSATLKATVRPEGGTVSNCHFEWGTDTSYGPDSVLGDERRRHGPAHGARAAHDLPLRVVATTEIGAVEGGDQSFTTLQPVAAGAPAVVTEAADGLTQSNVTLHGFVDPGGPTVADCHFDWGTDTSYGALGSLLAGRTVRATAPSPSRRHSRASHPDTTYVFRVVASNPGTASSAGGRRRSPRSRAATSSRPSGTSTRRAALRTPAISTGARPALPSASTG